MVDRAGLAGSDGDTHQGLLDIPWGRAIPNLEIYAPCDESTLRDAMLIASKRNGPTLIRYPRGAIPGENFVPLVHDEAIVKICDGEEWALLGHGPSVITMLETREQATIKPAVYDVRRIKPLDEKVLEDILTRYKTIATLEENYMPGGLGEAVGAKIAEGNYNVRLMRFGVPDVCVKHATQSQQRELYGLTSENILRCYEEQRTLG